MDPQEIKCVFVGDGNSGRTSFLITYFHGEFPGEYIPIVMDSDSRNVSVNGKEYKFCVLDTAGRADYDRLRPLSYVDTDVFGVVFSVISQTGYDNIRTKWVPEIKEHRAKTPFVTIGLKTDLRDDKQVLSKIDKVYSKSDGEKLAKELGAKTYVEGSSLTNKKGLENIIVELAKTAINDKQFKKKCKKSNKKTKNCTIL